MDEYPMTFNEFINSFSTEEQCRLYLYKLRWPDGFTCPKCNGQGYWSINNILYECKKCGHQASVIAGTIFQDTRTPLRTWFTAIWWIATQKNGASAEGLRQVLGLKSDETAWAWLHKIRRAMVRSDRTKLSGTVEMDDFYVGGEEHDGSTGRGTGNKTLVVVALELKAVNKLGRVRLSVIPAVTKEALEQFTERNIEKGTEVITDGFSSYSFLTEKGYKHTVYIQKKAKTEDERLPHVHLIVSLVKRWLLGTHQGAISEKHMQAYLDEYTFRFNRRKAAKRGLLFYRLLEGAVSVGPITTKELYNLTNDF